MKHEITDLSYWYEVDTSAGICFVERNLIGKITKPSNLLEFLPIFTEDDIWEITEVLGYGCRLSMPGYLDCTDWLVFPTIEECENYLKEEEGN